LLPSEPVTVTWEAFPATTVKVEELPAVIEAGLAAIVTVGAAATDTTVTVVTAGVAVPPGPVAVAV
jgi:hypothetical protein